MLVDIIPDKNNEGINRLVREWVKRDGRVTKVEHYVPFFTGRQVLENIKARLPSEKDTEEYKKSLILASISGIGRKMGGVSIISRSKLRKTATTKRDSRLIYIFPNDLAKRVKKEVVVLAEYNPWTLDTIPFIPAKKYADVVYKSSGIGLVRRERNYKKRLMSKVMSQLFRSGWRKQNRRTDMKLSKDSGKVTDVMLTGVNLEFGLGGMRRVPHWRLAIIMFLRNQLKKEIRTNRLLRRAMLDIKYRGWKGWTADTSCLISPGEASKFVPFQKMLGIKV